MSADDPECATREREWLAALRRRAALLEVKLGTFDVVLLCALRAFRKGVGRAAGERGAAASVRRD